MITKELYKAIRELTLKVQGGDKVAGSEFTDLYNIVFNATVKFSNCCPSENKNRLNRLKAEARKFELKHVKDANAIISELIGTEPAAEKTEEEKPDPEKKKRRGRPRKKKATGNQPGKEDAPEK